MQSLECSTGYPAHGEVIACLPSRICEYIDHNQKRERAVLQALSASRHRSEGSANPKGSLRLSELVSTMYGSVPDEISQLALQPHFAEVLEKLAEDRCVGFELSPDDLDSKRWFITRRGLTGGSRSF